MNAYITFVSYATCMHYSVKCINFVELIMEDPLYLITDDAIVYDIDTSGYDSAIDK